MKNLLSRLTAGIALGTALLSTNLQAEHIPRKPVPPTSMSFTVEDFRRVDEYDSIIEEALQYYKTIHRVAPDKNLIKGMILTESGRRVDKNTAFKYDPMQLTDTNLALDALFNKKEGSYLVGRFNFLEGISKTPKVNGKPDYSNTKISARKSIFGGIGWLYQKAAIYDSQVTESGDVKQYELKKGDSFSKIASRLGTTTETLVKLNPKLNPRALKIGTRVNYKIAKKELAIVAWRPWEEAVERYNGQGDRNYKSKVVENRKALDKSESRI